jgi:hypothetical protein
MASPCEGSPSGSRPWAGRCGWRIVRVGSAEWGETARVRPIGIMYAIAVNEGSPRPPLKARLPWKS